MRLAPVFSLALLLAATGARAETWVHTHDSGSGEPMCFDKDSPKPGADGLTEYAIKMCRDTVAQIYAVDCTKNFKVELLLRIYDHGNSGHYREFSVDDLDSGMAITANMACHK